MTEIIYTERAKAQAAAVSLVLQYYKEKAKGMKLKGAKKAKFILGESVVALKDFEKEYGPDWFLFEKHQK